LTVVDNQPPPPRETVRPAPRTGWVWVEGHWENRGGWVWVSGIWVEAQPNRVWIDGRWQQRNGQWFWVPGRWEVVATGTVTGPATGTGPSEPQPRVRQVDSYQNGTGGGPPGPPPSVPPPPG